MWGNDVKLTNVFKMVWRQQGIDTSCLWFPKKNPPGPVAWGGKGNKTPLPTKPSKVNCSKWWPNFRALGFKCHFFKYLFLLMMFKKLKGCIANPVTLIDSWISQSFWFPTFPNTIFHLVKRSANRNRRWRHYQRWPRLESKPLGMKMRPCNEAFRFVKICFWISSYTNCHIPSC